MRCRRFLLLEYAIICKKLSFVQDGQKYENIFVIISLRNTQENVENVTENAILNVGLLNTGPQDFFFSFFSPAALLSDLNSL